MTNSFINNSEQHGLEILIQGTVQGVGFRPFVYNLASRLEISGTVINTGDGVRIRAYAQGERLFAFVEALRTEAPTLARITSLGYQPLKPGSRPDSFTILASDAATGAATSIPADIAICEDCLSELHNPDDHRHNYPFINCTNCGPRFTIVETIPYDRPKTSMKVFPMCAICQQQYEDPADRRFHAQPNACQECGPEISLHYSNGEKIDCSSPLAEAASVLAAGEVCALRGLGGFHLIVDGGSEQAVALLRSRKGRPDKPLAVMMSDLEIAGKYCRLNAREEELLSSTIHPIVLLKKRSDCSLAPNLAPGVAELGVMLPYTPLHHLLFAQQGCPEVLVMTSGNTSGAPICTASDDAFARLSGIADIFVLHNREIVTRVDDSVTRIIGNTSQILRRARGYVPHPIEIPWQLPQVIGCGAGLKSTFTLGRLHSIFPSQHIGDLFNLESFEFYNESVEHLKRMLQIEPEIAVCDLHPDYLSSQYAKDLGLPLYQVQHHHAHAVAVMAEHGLQDPVLAVILDGTGYGPDNSIWGGEILRVDLTGYSRLAHLQQLRQPGGDKATQEPWRMAMAALHLLESGDDMEDIMLPSAIRSIASDKRVIINTMLQNNFNSPLTSSCGRLFDAVASLLGIRQQVSYEGQAAIELETLAKSSATTTWYNELPAYSAHLSQSLLCEKGEKWEICSLEFVKVILDSLAKDVSTADIALHFHYLLISSITELINLLSDNTGIRQIVLAGGCMQNSLLLEGLQHSLGLADFEVFTGESLPVNDGGISFGQTIIGGMQHVSRNTHESHEG